MTAGHVERGRRPRPLSQARVDRVMKTLAREIAAMELPAMEKIAAAHASDPFRVLIGTMLSSRTQDGTTHAATARLFRAARTPQAMAALTVPRIETLIYPVGFFRNKARFVKTTCEQLVERFDGNVPSTLEELVTLPGVGRKTANLVMILGFKSRRSICVDTHVHRITNRMGWVKTTEPDATEQALYASMDKRWWPYINLYLVTWGQNVCRPV